jgi:hypothetical protein
MPLDKETFAGDAGPIPNNLQTHASTRTAAFCAATARSCWRAAPHRHALARQPMRAPPWPTRRHRQAARRHQLRQPDPRVAARVGPAEGVSVDLAREAARRLGVALELVQLQLGRARWSRPSRRARSTWPSWPSTRCAPRTCRLHRALRDHRRRLPRAQCLAAAAQRGRRPRRHARRGRPRQRLRPVPHARDQGRHAGARADLARGDRHVPRAAARRGRRRAPAARGRCPRVGGVRMLPGRFMVIEQAMGVPKGRARRRRPGSAASSRR